MNRKYLFPLFVAIAIVGCNGKPDRFRAVTSTGDPSARRNLIDSISTRKLNIPQYDSFQTFGVTNPDGTVSTHWHKKKLQFRFSRYDCDSIGFGTEMPYADTAGDGGQYHPYPDSTLYRAFFSVSKENRLADSVEQKLYWRGISYGSGVTSVWGISVTIRDSWDGAAAVDVNADTVDSIEWIVWIKNGHLIMDTSIHAIRNDSFDVGGDRETGEGKVHIVMWGNIDVRPNTGPIDWIFLKRKNTQTITINKNK